jgi:hypothetical protein
MAEQERRDWRAPSLRWSSDATTRRPTTFALAHGRTRKRPAVGRPLGAGDRFVAEALVSPTTSN